MLRSLLRHRQREDEEGINDLFWHRPPGLATSCRLPRRYGIPRPAQVSPQVSPAELTGKHSVLGLPEGDLTVSGSLNKGNQDEVQPLNVVCYSVNVDDTVRTPAEQ